MLAGSDELIKPDRMIIRFLENISKENISLDESQVILSLVTKEMNKKDFNLTPRKLDNLIWNYQRDLN